MVALHQNDCQLLWQRADAQNISFFYPLQNSSSKLVIQYTFFAPSLGELFEQLEAQKIYFLIKLCFQVITRVTAVGRLHITVVHTNSLHYLYEVAYRVVVSRVKFFGIIGGGGVRRSFRNFKEFRKKQIIVNPAWAKFSLEIDYGTWWLIHVFLRAAFIPMMIHSVIRTMFIPIVVPAGILELGSSLSFSGHSNTSLLGNLKWNIVSRCCRVL